MPKVRAGPDKLADAFLAHNRPSKSFALLTAFDGFNNAAIALGADELVKSKSAPESNQDKRIKQLEKEFAILKKRLDGFKMEVA